ncbi:MAG: c-type cytochrome biogenesis protein CcmI [Burkholderiales bacterium]
MIVFWIVAGIFLAIALLFLLPPLVRRGQTGSDPQSVTVSIYRGQLAELDADLQAGTISKQQFEKAQHELEYRLLEETPPSGVVQQPAGGKNKLATAAAIAIAVPTCAMLLYFYLGNPDAIVSGKTAAAQQGDQEVTLGQVEAMVERLAARLKENPNDAKGWQMLARSYSAFGRFPEATDAYQSAVALAPNDPQLLADYADTLATANGGNLNGKPQELIQAALKLDPNHQKSLALAGTAAFNNKDYSAAITYWQRLQKTLPADSDNGLSVAKSIAEAQAAAGVSTLSPQPATVGKTSSVPDSGAIAGSVSLIPSLAAMTSPADTVFIFAKATSGPKMPLAVLKVQASDLPKAFSLDDSMAMTPAMKLSNFQEVTVGARISKSGNATAQRGDLVGSIGPVRLGSREVKVVIDGVVP